MSNNSASGGIGLSGAVFLIFLTLRLTDHIDWAWYWVAAPLWMPLGVVLALVVLIGGGALLFDWFSDRRIRRARAKRAQGKPATTESVDRMAREFADAVVKAANDDKPRVHPFMRGPK